jgi:predicted nucleic acid-binding protein
LKRYFDTAYVAKCYLKEADSVAVRKLAYGSSGLYSSAWCVPEMACVFQRQIREFKVPTAQVIRARDFFLQDVHGGVWSMLPLSEPFLFRVASLVAGLPPSLYLRAGEAIHLATAQEAGFSEIWSNDRRVLLAAPAFGLTGKSV